VHVLNQTVRCHDDIFARERLPDRGIVADPYSETARDLHFGWKRRGEKLDQSELADIANSTLVSHLSAHRRPVQVQAGVTGLVA
jgi:hypothetical protein